jgi:hypothetical protein
MTLTAKSALLLALALPALSAWATTYSVNFQATVNLTTPGSSLPAPGSMIAGAISYSDSPEHSSSQPVPGEGPGYANYSFSGGPFQYEVQSSAGTITSNLFVIEVFDQGSLLIPSDFPTDSIVFGTKLQNVYYGLFLTGPNETFSGSGIPTDATLNSDWSSARFVIWDQNNFTSLDASVTNLSVTVVPEPAAWLLLLAGLSALATRVAPRSRVDA